jgi:predicted kinase
MEAVIFIGIQGAGKSTFYRQRFLGTHTRISLDTLRTRRREQLLLESCLKAGEPFVVDNTNSLRTDRARYIGPARRAGFRIIAYFFHVPLQDAIRRNLQRESEQKVPVAALVSTFKKLQRPSLEEGFDKIFAVELTAENRFAVTSETASGEGKEQADK